MLRILTQHTDNKVWLNGRLEIEQMFNKVAKIMSAQKFAKKICKEHLLVAATAHPLSVKRYKTILTGNNRINGLLLL